MTYLFFIDDRLMEYGFTEVVLDTHTNFQHIQVSESIEFLFRQTLN
jgi:hypothetical protein